MARGYLSAAGLMILTTEPGLNANAVISATQKVRDSVIAYYSATGANAGEVDGIDFLVLKGETLLMQTSSATGGAIFLYLDSPAIELT